MPRFAKHVQGDRPAHSSRVSCEMPMTPPAGRKRGERGPVTGMPAKGV
jgi:hypothetical protein